MLAMHDHDSGASHFLSRSYHQPNDLATDSILKYQHHMNYLYQYPQTQLHHQVHHQQQQTPHHVDQSQHHHLLPLHQNGGAIHAHDRPTHPYAQHDAVSPALSYHHSFQQPHQDVTDVREDRQQMYHQAFVPIQPSSARSRVSYDEAEECEDVNEEDITELDDEELIRTYEQFRRRLRAQAPPDVTSQLLQFADTVSADIQKFFGRAKTHEDGCDVYEDKWTTTKSGRELYYADLLRIAQGDTEPASKTTRKSHNSSSTSQSTHDDQHNASRFSGKRNTSAGIGPLNELFQFGQHNFCNQKRGYHSKSKVNQAGSVHKQRGTIPMHERNFPESFWREPCTNDRSRGEQCPIPVFNNLGSNDPCVQSVFSGSSRCGPSSAFGDHRARAEHAHGAVMASSKLPDFADLVESWQGAVADTGHDRRHVVRGRDLQTHVLGSQFQPNV